MALVVTRKGFWHQSPWAEWARDQKLNHRVDIQTVHTHLSDPRIECKCSYKGVLTVEEIQGTWGKGECPGCKRPYLIEFV